jgi:hypothetical protein
MVFDIRFSGETTENSELGNAGYYGEVLLGDEREAFVSLIGFWSPRDYLQQWEEGIRRLVNQNKTSCLITSLHDPKEADILTWWLLYPLDHNVHVQNALLVLSEQRAKFATNSPYDAIPPRRQFTDEGDQISEWIVPLQDFAQFLRARDVGGR